MRKSKQAKTNFKPYEFGGFKNQAGLPTRDDEEEE